MSPQKGLPAKGAWAAIATQPQSTPKRALTPHKKEEKSCVATLSAAPLDRGKYNLVESALSRHTQFSTPSMAHLVESLEPTAAFPTSPTDDSGDIMREHPGEAPLRTIPTTLPTTNYQMDNPGEGRLQSAHYRLHGPGLLDVTLVPEKYRLHIPRQ